MSQCCGLKCVPTLSAGARGGGVEARAADEGVRRL